MTDCQFISFAGGSDKKSAEVSSVASTEGSIRNSDSNEVHVSCYLTEYGKRKRQQARYALFRCGAGNRPHTQGVY
jgi:hypothetical protein